VSVVNTAPAAREGVRVKLPGAGTVTALASGQALARSGDSVTVSLRPYQLLALRVDP
jgi:translation initiation factor IF-1